MDRSIIYDQSDVRSYDHLWGWRNNLIGLSQAVMDLLGTTSTMLAGFAATPASPASLVVNLAAGDLYQMADIDAAAYGSLTADTAQILQQGIAAAQTVTFSTSGLASGQSRWALVQAQFAQTDEIPGDDPNGGLLPYLNTSNPSGPAWSGPNNSGATQNTRRQGTVTISLVYGNVATTGSEVPPNPTSGWVPLYLVDLAYGQTQITQAEILTAGPSVGTNVPSTYPRAPFLQGLTQQGQYAPDTGTANAYAVSLVPPLTLHQVGMPIRWKAANTNTGASTFNDGGGSADLTTPNGDALPADFIVAGGMYVSVWDGAKFQVTSSPGSGVIQSGAVTAGHIAEWSASGAIEDGGILGPLANLGIGTGLQNNGAGGLQIAATGVGAGAYTLPNISINAEGQIVGITGGATALGGSGYQKLGSGLIIQWGSTGNVPSGGSLTVSFPTAFPNAVFSVAGNPNAVVNYDASNNQLWYIGGANTSGFTIYGNSPTANPSFYWIAIGY